MVFESGWPPFRQDGSRRNRVIFGVGSSRTLGEEPLVRDAKRILLLCSPRTARSESGRQVIDSLGAGRTTVFTEGGEHVPSTAVANGMRAAEGRGIDLIVSLGGGSTSGLGKALSLRIGGALDSPELPAIPHVAIPTTYSGSELTAVYGITEMDTHRKVVMRDDRALPALAVYDPELTLSLPARVTAGTGMNAMAHCVEILLCSPPDPECRAAGLEGIRRIASSLSACVHSPTNLAARSEMLVGAFLGGRALGYYGSALHHALCQALGGRTGISHGDANAIVLPHVLRFNAEAAPGPLAEMADVLKIPVAVDDPASAGHRLADYLTAFTAGLGLPRGLREVGVPRDVLPLVAEEVFARPAAHRNPRPLEGPEAILPILEAAWEGMHG